ncbi:glycosyltransferase [bacterium]|nr:glycosyltransferase [bacterium]
MALNITDKNVILITGNFEFPDANAAGKRVLGFGFILQELGYEPIFLGINKTLSAYDSIEDTCFEAYGMISYSLLYPRGMMGWANYSRQLRKAMYLIDKIGKHRLAAVIAYGSPAVSFWMNNLCSWSKKNGILFLADCVDWIQSSGKGIAYNVVKFLDTNFQKRVVIPRANAVIVVSRYLYNYYARKGCKLVMIPPVTDVRLHRDAIELSIKRLMDTGMDRITRFVYAGFPFSINKINKKNDFKDRLDRSIELFYKVIEKTNKFVFDIYGVTKNEYLTALPEHYRILEKMNKNISFHGRCVPQETIKGIINSDFSILHRDDNLVTRAGFPTKVSESISLGVPVIAENTSNIDDYIIDGHNGIWITPENEVEKIIELINFTNKMILEMKMNCIQDEIFDYRKYKSKFYELLV